MQLIFYQVRQTHRQTDVRELKYGLAASSAVAAGAGMTFKDTATTLAVFAQNGLKDQMQERL